MSRSTPAADPFRDLYVLEELFLDELGHKVRSFFALYDLPVASIREIKSFADRLEVLTREDLRLLDAYGQT